MSPKIQKSDLHQPKAKNQPQGQVRKENLGKSAELTLLQLAALLHGKLDYDDLFISSQGASSSNTALFPDDHRSNSAPPQQLLSSRRVNDVDGRQTDAEQMKYYQDNQQGVNQPWQLWQNNEEGNKCLIYLEDKIS